ncbi:MAG TPA: TolC family protein, partial [Desulfovibrio sp.]|nr:TolC family protein [Desulfovibrio sp.]
MRPRSIAAVLLAVLPWLALAMARPAMAADAPQPLTLPQCIAIALRDNAAPAAAREGLAIAEAQHRQALSAYWPQLTLSATQSRLDSDP